MYICLMANKSFPEWLNIELQRRDMIPADITKRTGLSSGQISRILSGDRNPGLDALLMIADALHIPRIQVFRAAGLLDGQGSSSLNIEILAHKISMLPPPTAGIFNHYSPT